MLTTNDVAKVYDTIMSIPGMNEPEQLASDSAFYFLNIWRIDFSHSWQEIFIAHVILQIGDTE
jgi:hypothetical protein